MRNTMSVRKAKLEISSAKATGSRLIGVEATTLELSLAEPTVSGFTPFGHIWTPTCANIFMLPSSAHLPSAMA